jgi:Pentapeptide repeats (8 copies)
MVNDQHVAVLNQGVAAWNAWREENPDIRPYLNAANLSGAILKRANLLEANFNSADLSGADLRRALLQSATLVDTDLTGADLTGCHIYGVSAWGLKLEEAKQQNLVITPLGQPEVTVDHIEVAQFIYLLLHNQKIRDVIDTITSKVVLILGRFTDARKAVLDALREELRKRDYLPLPERNSPLEPESGDDITSYETESRPIKARPGCYFFCRRNRDCCFVRSP